MKVLVVYDSVSESKMTKQVAETIWAALREKGVEADVRYCTEVDRTAVAGYDALLVGAPTMAFRPSKDISAFLDSLKGADLKGKKAAAFDTQIQSAVSGNAAKGIQKRLEGLGFAIFKEPLVVYVEGKGKGAWQFKAGEAEKARAWALEAAALLA